MQVFIVPALLPLRYTIDAGFYCASPPASSLYMAGLFLSSSFAVSIFRNINILTHTHTQKNPGFSQCKKNIAIDRNIGHHGTFFARFSLTMQCLRPPLLVGSCGFWIPGAEFLVTAPSLGSNCNSTQNFIYNKFCHGTKYVENRTHTSGSCMDRFSSSIMGYATIIPRIVNIAGVGVRGLGNWLRIGAHPPSPPPPTSPPQQDLLHFSSG